MLHPLSTCTAMLLNVDLFHYYLDDSMDELIVELNVRRQVKLLGLFTDRD